MSDRRHGEPLIVLRGVKKAYRTPAGDFYALKGIDLDIWPGEFVALLGRSGAGKSTLINMLTGIDRPTEGEIWIGGKAIHRMSESKLTQWRGREVGVVFQSFQLMPMLTCAQNVMLPMDFADLYGSPRQQYARALELLAAVEIAEHADKLPSAVSGGQRQRVAIARALAMKPDVLLLDEVTSALDPELVGEVLNVIRRLADNGMTMVLVTHEMAFAADTASRIIFMEAGRIAETGSPDEVLHNPKSERLRGFLSRFHA